MEYKFSHNISDQEKFEKFIFNMQIITPKTSVPFQKINVLNMFLNYLFVCVSIYNKPIFISVREIFTMLARASPSRIFLAADQSLSYGCNNSTGLVRLGREHKSSWTSSSIVNHEIKSLLIKVGLQYFCYHQKINMIKTEFTIFCLNRTRKMSI